MTASENIDKQIADNEPWKRDLMSTLRKLIHEAHPGIVEEWKWGTGVWTHKGLICAVSSFKDHVKINFFKGVNLLDPHKLINSGLESKQHRAIDFREGDSIDKAKVRELILEAVRLNDPTV